MSKSIVKIKGGIGNQLFQYAFASELIYKGQMVYLDTSYYENTPPEDTKRKYILDQLFETKKLPESEGRYINPAGIKRKLFKLLNLSYNIVVQSDDMLPEDINYSKNNYFEGYWQNEKWFINVAGEYKQEINKRIINIISKETKERIKWLDEQNDLGISVVAIHVRGGDYLNEINHSVFGTICDSQYYSKAIQYIKNNVNKCIFIVFTNDRDYTDRVLPAGTDYSFVANSEDDGLQDLYLMSKCNHIIMANSTFSWWGAWLNCNDNLKVICPAKWKASKDSKEICCRNWIII